MSIRLRTISILTAIAILLAALFHQHLLGMLVYHSLQTHFTPQLAFTQYTITSVTLPNAEPPLPQNDPLRVGTMIVPIPFSEDPKKRTPNLVANDTQVIALYDAETRNIITRINDTHGTDVVQQTATCTLLSRRFGDTSCESNYAIYRAYLDLDFSDISFFTPARQQQVFYQLLLAKNVSEPAAQSKSFSTDQLRGFISLIQTNTYKVVVFVDNQLSHEMLFTGFSEAEVLQVLSSISKVE